MEKRVRRLRNISKLASLTVYLNGCAAYEAGFRAWIASAFAEYDRLLAQSSTSPEVPSCGPQGVPIALSLFPLLTSWQLDVATKSGMSVGKLLCASTNRQVAISSEFL